MSKIELSLKDIKQAKKRLEQRLQQTPLTFSEELSRRFERNLYVKWDNKFRTGSFKERGALNFLLQLIDREENPIVCTASAGNHALAVSWHAKQLDIPCTVVMPESAPLVKVNMTEAFGAEVMLEGQIFDHTYKHAQQLAEETGKTFVPGYDHPDIISGQGVSGLEIYEQSLKAVDAVVIPIGGGGLASGIALALKSINPDIFILGVRSIWTTEKHNPQNKFRPVPIGDGIAVKTIGSLNAPILDKYVDEMVYVSENDIASAIVDYLDCERTVVEGAGAAALAAVRAGYLPEEYRTPVILACGSNIDLNVLARLIQRAQFKRNKLLRVRVSVPDRPGTLAHLTNTISNTRANVLETFHERTSSSNPASVDITFLLETRDSEHKNEVLETLSDLNLWPTEI